MLTLALTILSGLWAPRAGAQWTVTLDVDRQQALAALGPTRVGKMNEAVQRVKVRLEQVLSGSTGSVTITVNWVAPTSPTAAAESQTSQLHPATVAVARDKLINQATADNEPASEILLYESLSSASVPFRFENPTPLSALFVLIPNSLNKHLGFQPTTNQNDGFVRFRPETATLKWQFWEKKGAQLPDHELFEAVALHECLHVLGFLTAAEQSVTPNTILSWDLFRFADASTPIGPDDFLVLPRELRPTQEASAITAFNSASQQHPLSRGERTGGDGFQASHWRAFTRLTPPSAVGVMDPVASGAVHQNLNGKFFTKPDVEALDVIGWNANPTVLSFADPPPIDLIAPVAGAQIAQGTPITFQWTPGGFLSYGVYIFPGTAIVDDNPARVFYQLPPGTTSASLPCPVVCGNFNELGFEALPPGEYVWYVIGNMMFANGGSEERRLTILATCPADVDDGSGTGTPDGGVTVDDLVYFLSAYAEGNLDADLDDGTGTGTPDQGVTIDDLVYFITRFEGGC